MAAALRRSGTLGPQHWLGASPSASAQSPLRTRPRHRPHRRRRACRSGHHHCHSRCCDCWWIDIFSRWDVPGRQNRFQSSASARPQRRCFGRRVWCASGHRRRGRLLLLLLSWQRRCCCCCCQGVCCLHHCHYPPRLLLLLFSARRRKGLMRHCQGPHSCNSRRHQRRPRYLRHHGVHHHHHHHA